MLLSAYLIYELSRIAALDYSQFDRYKEKIQTITEKIDCKEARFLILTPKLIFCYASGEFEEIYSLYKEYNEMKNNFKNGLLKTLSIFWRLILDLVISLQKNSLLQNTASKTIYFIGESHSLVPSNRTLTKGNEIYKAESKFVMGAKIFHLQGSYYSYQNKAIREAINDVGNDSIICFSIGEIDCRADEGILPYSKKKNNDAFGVAEKTVDGYLEQISLLCKGKRFNEVVIQGVPLANPLQKTNSATFNFEDVNDLRSIVNTFLRIGCQRYGFVFFDLAGAMANFSDNENLSAHIDGINAVPEVYEYFERLLTP